MKILFLASSLSAGGAERVATTLCNAWSERGDSVILVPTFSGGGAPFYPLSSAVNLVYLASVVKGSAKGLSGYLKRFLALRSIIKKEKPDVIVSFLPNVNIFAILSSFFNNIPVLCCERSDPLAQPLPLIWRVACFFFYRFSTALVVQTESVEGKVRGFFPGLKKIFVIANPLPSEVVNSARNHCDPGGRKVLLSLGRLSSEKQVDLIIYAFSECVDQFVDWDLHIYGEGPSADDLIALVGRLGLEGRVFFKGRTSSPFEVMSAAEAFVMASRYEGFPNALLEAMGVGLPCISFDCPSGPREMSKNGLDALLVPLDDMAALSGSFKKIMRDDTFRSVLGGQARVSVCARYSLIAVLLRWDQLFREVKVNI